MSAAPRIRGEDVEVMIVVDNAIDTTFTDIKSVEVSYDFEIKEEGYVGEKSNRYDDIYKGASGKISMHNSTPALFDFFQKIKNRAQRRTPGVKVNIKATLNYPSGERRRVIMQDVFFDPMGLNFAGRTEYGASDLSFKCSEPRVL